MKLVTISKYTFNTTHIVCVERKSSRLAVVSLVTGEQITSLSITRVRSPLFLKKSRIVLLRTFRKRRKFTAGKKIKATGESGQKLLSPKQAAETKQPRKRVYTLKSKVSIVKQNNPV
jgi:hypothetical protein